MTFDRNTRRVSGVTTETHEPDLMLIEGGVFMMGSDSGREDEVPAHEVEVSSFYISRYAVTNREYAIFLERTSTPPPPSWGDPRFCHPEQPVVAVSWFEAVAYCNWLGSVLGGAYRLPTEAEREFSCRAGTATAFPWGDRPDRDVGDYGRRWQQSGPEIVGGPPNAFGLCNMADNVHEWCMDWYGRDYYLRRERLNPQGPETGNRRASRGGSWRHQVKVTRCAARSALDPSFRYTDYGFRTASNYGGLG